MLKVDIYDNALFSGMLLGITRHHGNRLEIIWAILIISREPCYTRIYSQSLVHSGAYALLLSIISPELIPFFLIISYCRINLLKMRKQGFLNISSKHFSNKFHINLGSYAN